MTASVSQPSPLQKAIRIAGSQAALARLLERDQTTISTWLVKYGGRVPSDMAVKIEKALNGQVTRQELRPDLFD